MAREILRFEPLSWNRPLIINNVLRFYNNKLFKRKYLPTGMEIMYNIPMSVSLLILERGSKKMKKS